MTEQLAPSLLTVDRENDQLRVTEYGRVWDGQLEISEFESDERVQLLEEDGRTVAFTVHEPFEVDLDEVTEPELWDGPKFQVPSLALPPSSIGEVVLAARGQYADGASTVDAIFFHLAIGSDDPEEGAMLWRAVIEAGDLKGHFGLGYTLYELEWFREAHTHLRHYTELTPQNSWAWCWLGKACEAIHDRHGATEAYRRAIQLESTGGYETDAPELLEAMAGPRDREVEG